MTAGRANPNFKHIKNGNGLVWQGNEFLRNAHNENSTPTGMNILRA
jgi:hypothetical protein